jgi:hypothetical protein
MPGLWEGIPNHPIANNKMGNMQFDMAAS